MAYCNYSCILAWFEAILGLCTFLWLASTIEALKIIPQIKISQQTRFREPRLLISAAYLALLFSGIMITAAWISLNSFNHYQAKIALASIFVTTIFCDTGSYFVGCLFGKRLGNKFWGEDYLLAPSFSEKKTKIGAIGGYLIGTIAFVTFVIALTPVTISNPRHCFVLATLGILISGLSIAGDLIQSACKRLANIKDSSSALRGHGGFWDRTDGLFFITGFFSGICCITMLIAYCLVTISN